VAGEEENCHKKPRRAVNSEHEPTVQSIRSSTARRTTTAATTSASSTATRCGRQRMPVQHPRAHVSSSVTEDDCAVLASPAMASSSASASSSTLSSGGKHPFGHPFGREKEQKKEKTTPIEGVAVALEHGEQIFYKFGGKMTRGIVVKAPCRGNGTWPTIDFGKGYKRQVLVTEGNEGDCWCRSPPSRRVKTEETSSTSSTSCSAALSPAVAALTTVVRSRSIATDTSSIDTHMDARAALPQQEPLRASVSPVVTISIASCRQHDYHEQHDQHDHHRWHTYAQCALQHSRAQIPDPA
jgi:hypothetical protein